MIQRPQEIEAIRKLTEIFPVTAILGARQVGKSTIARELSANYYYDLENPVDLLKLENPQYLFNTLSGMVVIDEVQRKPDLFPYLRYLCDNRHDLRFVLLGSASPDLLKSSSESLAGRIGYHFLGGFRLNEVDFDYRKLWVQGSFPRAFLLDTELSNLWKENFISTFLERDVPQLGINIPSQTLRRFWTMLAHYHGQILNFSELSRSFGVSDMTIRRYIEILEGTFMVRLLQPWHENVGKRLVKSPKLYIRDTGILHSLLTTENESQLLSHPKLGASWEGFCIENAIRSLSRKTVHFYFYSTYSGAEIDLIWAFGGKKYGLEVKFSDTPRISRSLTTSLNDLSLDKVWILYPGSETIVLSEKVTALPVNKLDEMLHNEDVEKS
jgi:predicted AAA+ superfamily ATPase